ncbi:MAG TPA: hypothetical protein VN372_06685 [Methanospirillum sp.]|nr:hypothetical protein [Methanospirillum sp.]
MLLLKKKWSLLIYSLILVVTLIVIRIVIDHYNLDIIAMNPAISALITGVIFTIAVIFTGTLTDYKESEKIPGELAAAIKSLYSDSFIFTSADADLIERYKQSIRDLYQVMVANFRSNQWDINAVHQAELEINKRFAELGIQNVAPPVLVKLRNELTTIDRISNRIKQIKDTDFIPAAYAISEMSVGFVIIILLFLKGDSLIESIFILTAITMMITGLFFLIKDMDDPFELDVGASADVDMFLFLELEQYLRD